MIAQGDLKNMGYFDSKLDINDTLDQFTAYSEWVENMIITPPEKR